MIGTIYCEWSGCPAPELIKPCVCEDNGIKCVDNSEIDLVNIFQSLEKNLTKSEKHFKSFHFMENTFINELVENTFKDITFDEIEIYKCHNLTKIHKNAFAETDLVTRELRFLSNYRLSSLDNSIFEVFSKFVNLERLYVDFNNITEIPSNAFQRIEGYQDKLSDLRFSGESIRKIGSRAFYSLRGLSSLEIYETFIDYIPEYAFEFEEESNERMTLTLGYSKLNDSNFQKDVFSHFKRPVDLNLGYAIFEYLEENVFENFLSSNPQNRILMTSKGINCDNCKNFWLRKQALSGRVIGLKCSNDKKLQ